MARTAVVVDFKAKYSFACVVRWEFRQFQSKARQGDGNTISLTNDGYPWLKRKIISGDIEESQFACDVLDGLSLNLSLSRGKKEIVFGYGGCLL